LYCNSQIIIYITFNFRILFNKHLNSVFNSFSYMSRELNFFKTFYNSKPISDFWFLKKNYIFFTLNIIVYSSCVTEKNLGGNNLLTEIKTLGPLGLNIFLFYVYLFFLWHHYWGAELSVNPQTHGLKPIYYVPIPNIICFYTSLKTHFMV